MFNPSTLILFSIALLIITTTAFDSTPNNLHPSIHHHQKRNLDPVPHAVDMLQDIGAPGLRVPLDPPGLDSLDTRISNNWAVMISSNETILSDGGCPLFQALQCSSPACSEDAFGPASLQYPSFTSYNPSVLNLPNHIISIADGIWKLSHSLLLIHNCDTNRKKGITPPGQIGLGLNGKARQNFQTSNPIFSILIQPSSTKLIFGLDLKYIENSSQEAISIPCDLDWKMRALGMRFGDFSIVSTSPVTMVFDIQTWSITLPEPYYSNLRSYYFNMTTMRGCNDFSKFQGFVCFFVGDINDLPPLVFVLEDGTQLSLSPLSYIHISQQVYSIQFAVYSSTYPGVDYIILGTKVMATYYTVFQQLDNQTPTITLYPVAPGISSPGQQQFSGSNDINPLGVSEISGKTDSSENNNNSSNTNATIIESNILSPSPSSTNITIISSENVSEDSEDVRNMSDGNVIFVIEGIIGLIVVSGIAGLLVGLKRGWFNRKKSIEASRQTVEMNESSLFVANTGNVDHADEMSD